MKSKLIFLIGLLSPVVFEIQAQDTISYKPNTSYSFIKNELNVIHHAANLEPFYEKLLKLKSSVGVVNILHIGDSHIQADYLTKATRALLQENFGNAGLGLSFPGRIARTNESPLIYSSAKGQWTGGRLTYSQNPLPMGIGGISVKTELAGNSLKIKSLNQNYSFNRMTLFFQKDFSSYSVIVKDSTGTPLAMAGAFSDEAYPNVSKLVLPYSINQVQLETDQSLTTQKQFILFGVSLENSNPGIRYHIIGVNGAKYKHFIAAKELLNQTPALSPDLIIISLGTNEAFEHPNLDPKFTSQLSTLTSELKRLNPDAIILLTTTPDFYKKRSRRNPGIAVINNKLIEFANANQIPFWNLHEVAGGNHAADWWKKNELIQTDGIHFTKKGYDLQGHLLYEAMVKGYNDYVLDRHSKTH